MSLGYNWTFSGADTNLIDRNPARAVFVVARTRLERKLRDYGGFRYGIVIA